MSAPRLPLYHVVTGLSDADAPEPVTFASAASYAASLDAHGIPARIVFAESVTHAERTRRQNARTCAIVRTGNGCGKCGGM